MDKLVIEDFKKNYKQFNSLVNNENILKVFVLGNTRLNGSDDYYFTPIRRHENIILFGAVVFSEIEAEIILKLADGLFDFIYVDAEKKSKKSFSNGIFNLERLASELVSKSGLRFYKGNDITTESINNFIVNYFGTKNKLIGGLNILIVGIGNLGFKLALKLVERGASVFLLSRDFKKAKVVSDTINMIKPKETLASVVPINGISDKNIFDIAKYLDVVLLTHLSTIPEYSNFYLSLNSNALFLDVGKGCLSSEQLDSLSNKGVTCYRSDVGDELLHFILSDSKKNIIRKINLETKKHGEIRIIPPGVIGLEGDVVVDDINFVRIVYGICDGKGSFKKIISDSEESLLNEIKKNE
jgi:hypothetical protein